MPAPVAAGPASKKRALAEFEEEWESIVEQEEDTTDEVQIYLRLNPNMEGDGRDVLHLGQQHETVLPLLSRLARTVFSVPASSSSSERAFSTAGRIIDWIKAFHCGCCAFSSRCSLRDCSSGSSHVSFFVWVLHFFFHKGLVHNCSLHF